MRRVNLRQRGEISFNMTPMIDVTFLLIVFFLVSSHLARQEVPLELDLPEAASGEPLADDARRLVVNVLPDGELIVAGRRVEPGELERVIEIERGSSNRELEIRIRSDRQVPYRFVEPVMLAAARAGVWRVSFAVVRGAPSA